MLKEDCFQKKASMILLAFVSRHPFFNPSQGLEMRAVVACVFIVLKILIITNTVEQGNDYVWALMMCCVNLQHLDINKPVFCMKPV